MTELKKKLNRGRYRQSRRTSGISESAMEPSRRMPPISRLNGKFFYAVASDNKTMAKIDVANDGGCLNNAVPAKGDVLRHQRGQGVSSTE